MRILVGFLVALAGVAAVSAAAARRFSAHVDQEARALLEGAAPPAARFVSAQDLAKLPAPVQRWLELSGAVGHARAATVRLQQRGEMRTGPDKPWMPVEAEQYFSVDPPSFVWRVKARMMRVLPIAGRDRYVGGRGQMLIKAASLITVADAAGPEIDQGALLRYLGEIVWFPSAALSETIAWEPIDDRHARATMRYADVSASMVYTFDEYGRVAEESAHRYMSAGGTSRLEEWHIPMTAWGRFCGVEVPVRGNAVWKLASGDFDYYRWEIVALEVNHAALYADEPAPPVGAAR